jgi:hypothetical protein
LDNRLISEFNQSDPFSLDKVFDGLIWKA